MSYSNFEKLCGLDPAETIRLLQSDLGTSLIFPSTNQRIILYSDAYPRETYRFTVAHELGHLFLGHPAFLTIKKTGVEKIDISEADYQNYEKEANAFARNLLSPAPLAKSVIEKAPSGYESSYIESAFLVSNSAAKVRTRYINRDLRECTKHMLHYAQGMNVLSHRYCARCGTMVPDNNNYCEICSGNDFAVSPQYQKTPHSIPRHKKSGQFIYCPVCHNEEISPDSHYCKICGAPIQNFCTENPSHHNRSYAKFCAECGAPTTYGKLNIFKRFQEGDDAAMKYCDGVDYDKDTMQVKICPVCKNEEFSEGAVYCRICGAPLYNTCEDGIRQDINREPIVLKMHANPPNARFCECCGKPTIYNKIHILRDYKTYVETEAKDLVIMGLCDNEDEAKKLVTAPIDKPDPDQNSVVALPVTQSDTDASFIAAPFDVNEELL